MKPDLASDAECGSILEGETYRYVRVLNGWVKVMDRVYWPGKDGTSKSPGIRKGRVDEVHADGSIRICVTESSQSIAAKYHTIQRNQLRKVMM